MTRDALLTLSQRLREYNHNPHHINPVSDAFHKLIAESAEALSQLAAIQGGMGEEVEADVVGWRTQSAGVPEGWRAAAIPAEKPLPELMMASYHEAIGWNACRQAMLASTGVPYK